MYGAPFVSQKRTSSIVYGLSSCVLPAECPGAFPGWNVPLLSGGTSRWPSGRGWLFLGCSSETTPTPGTPDLRTPTPGGGAASRLLSLALCFPPSAFCFLPSAFPSCSFVENLFFRSLSFTKKLFPSRSSLLRGESFLLPPSSVLRPPPLNNRYNYHNVRDPCHPPTNRHRHAPLHARSRARRHRHC